MSDENNVPKPAIDDAVREQYDKEFDSEFYLKSYFNEVYFVEETALRKLLDIFTQGTLKGPLKRCIDIGCGPIVHRMSAPSKVCDSIVYSDFSSNNRKLVQDWINGPVPNTEHGNVFKFCAKLEGFDDLEKGAIGIETRIKSKNPVVWPINVLEPEPLGQVHFEPFDVAFSGACLESACDNCESFKAAIKNIATIIRDGGYLILKGFLGCTFYVVNDIKFPCLSLSVDMIKNALDEGGFKVLGDMDGGELVDEETRELLKANINIVQENQISDCTGCFFVLAQKIMK